MFSHTVAASICTYVRLGVLPPSAMGTAQLVLKFDSLFDSVKSSTLHSPKELKRAISEKSGHINFFKEAITFIKCLKVYDVTGRITCLKGWVISLNAILLIWDNLKKNHGFKTSLALFGSREGIVKPPHQLSLLGHLESYSLVLFSPPPLAIVKQIWIPSFPSFPLRLLLLHW